MFKDLFTNAIDGYVAAEAFFGNTTIEYLYAAAVFIVLWGVFALVYRVILHRVRKWAKKTETDFDDVIIEIIHSIRPPFYIFIALFLGITTLALDSTLFTTLTVILYVWIAHYGIRALTRLTRYVVRRSVTPELEEESLYTTRFLVGIVRWALWVVVVIFILNNLGVEVTSLIAGLGVGGIAIAFALQNILSDLFSSFAIHFDKPFVIGDFIQVGEYLGTVTKIGIKTTRVQSLTGEELIFSNRQLTSEKIQNYGRMEERRIQFSFGVTYQTPAEKVGRIGEIVEEIISGIEQTRFDRANFKQLGDSSLNFEVVYFILTPDYNEYMDIQEEINLALMRRFEEEGIEFAYPTRTVFVQK
ncbi:MAG: mechanosensitive ion channel family protein [Candidatus Paceibacterota bacterium]